MKVKALISFSGVISMGKGELRNIETKEVLSDLIRCGYVEPVETVNVSPPLEDIGEKVEEQPGNETGDTMNERKTGQKRTAGKAKE